MAMKNFFENFKKKVETREVQSAKAYGVEDSSPVPLRSVEETEEQHSEKEFTVSPHDVGAQPPLGWLYEKYGTPEAIGEEELHIVNFRLIVINTQKSTGETNAYAIERQSDGSYLVSSNNTKRGMIPPEVAQKVTLQRGKSFYFGDINTPLNTSPVIGGTVYT